MEENEESKKLVAVSILSGIVSLISLGGMYYHFKKANELESKVNLLEMELSGVKDVSSQVRTKRDYKLSDTLPSKRFRILQKHGEGQKGRGIGRLLTSGDIYSGYRAK